MVAQYIRGPTQHRSNTPTDNCGNRKMTETWTLKLWEEHDWIEVAGIHTTNLLLMNIPYPKAATTPSSLILCTWELQQTLISFSSRCFSRWKKYNFWFEKSFRSPVVANQATLSPYTCSTHHLSRFKIQPAGDFRNPRETNWRSSV